MIKDLIYIPPKDDIKFKPGIVYWNGKNYYTQIPVDHIPDATKMIKKREKRGRKL